MRIKLRAFATVVGLVAALSQLTLAQPPVTDPADALFDGSVLHDLRLTISSRDWESLKIHYLDNTMYQADLRWRDQVVRGIGIRSRGTGSRRFEKPGLLFDFNYYIAKQSFLGLNSIVVRNQTQDPSNIRERVAMLFFQRMGIEAPRESHARLFINNQYAGLYTIVENINEEFLTRNIGENRGYLYEYKFNVQAEKPYVFQYLGSNPALYAPIPFKPESHENDPRPEFIVRWIDTINNASDAVWRTAMAEYLDLPQFMRHLAVESFLGEEDGITGDYGPNNFFVYRADGSSRFRFFPWDKSNAFWEPDYSIFRNITEGPDDHRNVLVLRAMRYSDLRNAYLDALLECADSNLEGVTLQEPRTWLEREIVRQYEQIREAALLDTSKPFTNAEFETAIEDLKTFARERSERVRAQVAAAR